MKKEVFKNILFGSLISIFILNILLIIISALKGDGNIYIVTPNLVEALGIPFKAVIFQFITTLIYGGIVGGVSTIFNSEKISILKITIIHFLVTFSGYYVLSYLNYWIDHDLISQIVRNLWLMIVSIFPKTDVFYSFDFNYGTLLSYLTIFTGIYVFIWLFKYIAFKKKLNEMNSILKEKKIGGKEDEKN